MLKTIKENKEEIKEMLSVANAKKLPLWTSQISVPPYKAWYFEEFNE